MATKKKRVSTKTSASTAKKTSTRANSDFWKVEFNVNTLYWIAIGIAVISTAIWTYNTNLQISELYDRIDQTNASVEY